MSSTAPIAPGAQIELRDAVWRVERVDLTSVGRQAWRCIGISEIVRDQEAIFLEEYEPEVKVLDPRETRLERDTSSQHRAGLLYVESLLRDVPPPDEGLYVGHHAAMDALDFQLDPAWMALSKPRQRILIADSVGLGKTLEAGILLSELIRRGRGRRILVAATKAMLTQFQKEMWARFTIPLVRLDSVGLFSSPRACLAQLRSPLRRKRIADALPELERKKLLDLKKVATSTALEHAAACLPNDPVAVDLLALSELARAVETITRDGFSKYLKLLETLDLLGWKARSAKEDRLVIFTERRETLSFLAEYLSADLGLKEGQWEVLHGALPDTDQQRIVEDFGKSAAAVRLLLASDAASEGLNLHYLCHRLIHFDVPWSLMVFQQRNGRVDRYGQTASPRIGYLHTDSRNEVIRGDNRSLTVLREKAERAFENIGDPSAFMGVYAVEEEERVTAEAMQSGTSAEELSATLDANLVDPFALLLEEAALDAPSAAPTHTAPSLFASDFDFFAAGVERLKETEELQATVDTSERLIELKWPDDLKRRFWKLPGESRCDAGVKRFENLLETTALGREPTPNAAEEVDVERLSRLLPPTIEAVERRVLTGRDRFRADAGPKLLKAYVVGAGHHHDSGRPRCNDHEGL